LGVARIKRDHLFELGFRFGPVLILHEKLAELVMRLDDSRFHALRLVSMSRSPALSLMF
jgi:hypothetical protein